MPAEVITTERFAVYSTDGSNDDAKSVGSDRNSFIFRDHDCTDLTELQNINGKVLSCSPIHSSTTVDKWGSYWSRRERCCCFWNFLLSVALVLTVAVVILATKGVVLSNSSDRNRSEDHEDKGLSGYIAPIDNRCSNESPEPKDFYSYACGGFMEKVRLSWNSPRKRTDPDLILSDHFSVLRDSLSEDVLSDDSNEVEIIKTVYQSCLQHKNTPLTKVHKVIDSLGGFEFGLYGSTKQFDLTTLLTEVILRYGISPLFEIEMGKGGKIGIYNKFTDEDGGKKMKIGIINHRFKFLKPSDFFYRNEETDLILQAYKKYISDFLAYILGINGTMMSDQRFMSLVDDIYHLNVYINRVFYTEDVTNFSDGMSKCNNQLSIEELQLQHPYNISWEGLFSALFKNSPFSQNYTICMVSLTTAISDVWSGFTFTTLKRYIILQVLMASDISYLLPVETLNFDKVSWNHGALFGEKSERLSENDCLREISKHLPMYFVILNHISDQFNDTLMRLFTDLISSIERIIRDLYWIPIKQKTYLLTELQGLTMQLDWRTSADQSFTKYMHDVSDDYFENMHLMIQYSMNRYFNGRPQHAVSEMDSSIFHLREKELEIPISVRQVPLVYASKLPSLWIGSLGTYISQAISELFDIEALLRFLTEEKIDHKVALTIAFRLQCLLDEYNKYTLHSEDGAREHIRGDLTKSANFKDSLALRVVYDTYTKMKMPEEKTIPGLNLTQDQLFFLSYAQSMCEKTNLRGTRYYYIDTTTTHHSPGKYRVIGTLSHFKKFAEAFRCPLDSEMNPKNKCSFF